MSYIQYAIETPDGNIRRSGCEASLQCKYGGSVQQTVSATTTFTKYTKDKMMAGDLQFGVSPVISCNNKIMPTDIVVKAQEVTGNRYHELTSSGTWIVPPGVDKIEVICIGGGGGTTGGYKGPDYYDTHYQCPGAGGGYVKHQYVSVVPGQTVIASIGAAGQRGYASWYSSSWVEPTDGGATIVSVNGVTVTGSGGKRMSSGGNRGADGGSGGAANYRFTGAKNGGSNGGDGENWTDMPVTTYPGLGQISQSGPNGESGNTTVNNYVYSAGGGTYGGQNGRGQTGDAAAANTGDGANGSNVDGWGYSGGSGKVIIKW